MLFYIQRNPWNGYRHNHTKHTAWVLHSVPRAIHRLYYIQKKEEMTTDAT